ncbi:MAG: secondary thiamine-phosphate synthase enzyme YjbQ [Candidatus Hydrogenedentota bacterium]
MKAVSTTFSVATQGNCDIIDITSKVTQFVNKEKIKHGILTVFIPGSTCGITTIEYESGLISDLKEVEEKIVPENKNYKHNLRWSDGNGHSHLRASLMGASLTIPVVSGELTLGTWQQIVICDFDNRPRNRDIVLQIIGE